MISIEETSGLVNYVDVFKNRLFFFAFDVAKRHLQQAQRDMKGWYDKKVRTGSFAPGDQEFVFLPIPGKPLCAKFVGP